MRISEKNKVPLLKRLEGYQMRTIEEIMGISEKETVSLGTIEEIAGIHKKVMKAPLLQRLDAYKMRHLEDIEGKPTNIMPQKIRLPKGKKTKYAIVLGTRPEIIKMAPIIKELEQRGLDYVIVHSGQHYSPNMDSDIFEDLNLLKPRYNLKVGSSSRKKQIREIKKRLKKVLEDEKPDIVLVEGDTNTVVAGAYAASNLGIKVGHVEAGLRSYDKRMPEEINRILTDRISDYLFAPTLRSKENLLEEGIEENKIYIIGNTIVDATLQNLEISNHDSHYAKGLIGRLNTSDYIFLTLHRQSNVDSKTQLTIILEEIVKIPKEYGLEIVFPLHPRTKKMISKYNLGRYVERSKGILATQAVGYLDCLQLESKAKLIMTDSGGLQEESCILGVPCITLRENTERPETVEVGSNTLIGKEYHKLLDCVGKSLKKGNNWKNPYGDGKTAEKIVEIIQNDLGLIKCAE